MDKRYAIFDMDGTLADSMPAWAALDDHYLRAQGVEPDPARLAQVHTMTMSQGAAYFMEAFGLPGPPARIVAGMEAMMERRYRTEIPLKPGAADYLAALRGRGVRLCVATATAEPLARAFFTRFGLAGCFDFLLSCEDVGAGKTDPRIYLRAAELFGAPPGEIAVYEDAPYAARTAKNAGFHVVAVAEPAYARDWPALCALAHEIIYDWRSAL